jgi:hypothetical protein
MPLVQIELSCGPAYEAIKNFGLVSPGKISNFSIGRVALHKSFGEFSEQYYGYLMSAVEKLIVSLRRKNCRVQMNANKRHKIGF